METNKKRIDTLINTLATFNDSPGNGVTRFSFSEKDRSAIEKYDIPNDV